MRDPTSPGWPECGERTELEDVANRWKWAYLDHVQSAARDRQLGRKPQRRLGEAVGAFLEYVQRTWADNTAGSYTTFANRLRDELGADVVVPGIRPDRLQRALDAMVDAGYAESTVTTCRAVWCAFFTWAEVSPNPAHATSAPAIPERDIFAWSADQVEKLREAADKVDVGRKGPPLARRLLELGLGTGGRASELRALGGDDFNVEARTVRFSRQFGDTGTTVRPLKSKRNRTALVLPALWDHLPPGDDYVLRDRNGRTLSDTRARDLMQRIMDTADLNGPGRGLHDLRRTYGRLFLEAGGWMDELQRALGHKSIRTTERQYARFQADVAAQFARSRIYGEGRLRLLG